LSSWFEFAPGCRRAVSIANSLENIPVFLEMTSGFPAESREILARKIAVDGFALLVVSVMIGTHILAFFGISLPVVLIGGALSWLQPDGNS
jgi:multiple antibiotic resistance protein